jgi:hypothetical protein
MAQNLHRQLSGPYSDAMVFGGNAELNSNDGALTFWGGLSIDNADDARLLQIGYLIGYPWPSAPAGSFDANNLEFYNDPTGVSPPPVDNNKGFGNTENPVIGGVFQDATPGIGNYIPAAMYRALLKAVAQIKFNGLSLSRICSLLSFFSNSFVISYDANKDIAATFSVDIGSGNIWVAQEAFSAVTTAPRVLVSYVP